MRGSESFLGGHLLYPLRQDQARESHQPQALRTRRPPALSLAVNLEDIKFSRSNFFALVATEALSISKPKAIFP
jgi:hypothetical protein